MVLSGADGPWSDFEAVGLGNPGRGVVSAFRTGTGPACEDPFLSPGDGVTACVAA